jgi:hypothetical protein
MDPPVPLIGITGHLRHGKDAIASILENHFKYVHVSFAMFLKAACKSIFSLSDSQLHSDEKDVVDARWNVTPRRLFQVIGTELFRDRLKEVLPELGKETLWISAMRNYMKLFPPGTLFVVSDVRFRDEAEMVRELGGKIWKVHRPSMPSSEVHVSETEIQSIETDECIENDGSLLELETKVRILMNDKPRGIKLNVHGLDGLEALNVAIKKLKSTNNE